VVSAAAAPAEPAAATPPPRRPPPPRPSPPWSPPPHPLPPRKRAAVAATRASRFGLRTPNSNPHILCGSDSEKNRSTRICTGRYRIPEILIEVRAAFLEHLGKNVRKKAKKKLRTASALIGLENSGVEWHLALQSLREPVCH